MPMQSLFQQVIPTQGFKDNARTMLMPEVIKEIRVIMLLVLSLEVDTEYFPNAGTD